MKSCYTDFDRHHRGFVTASQVHLYIYTTQFAHYTSENISICTVFFFSLQFHRSFPGPAEVSPAEITALAQFYYDPATGLHNYLQFHNDIVSLDREEGGTKEGIQLDINVKVLEVYSAILVIN